MGRTIYSIIAGRWNGEGGIREVLVVAFPLIMSTGSWSVQHFVDRMFLSWHSPEAIAASMPAGILSFTIMSFFMGIAGYVNVFVAQYYGAGMNERVGPSVWQGVYVSVVGGVFMLLIVPFVEPIFNLIGHALVVRQYEIIYFKILCLGAFPAIGASAFSGFFTGLSRTWPVMWINVFGTAVNLILDYLLIFGNYGCPEMGIAGAGIATVIGMTVQCLLYVILLAAPGNNKTYGTISGWRFDKGLFDRLMKYGFPNGVQFFIDIAGFTMFLLFVGRLGTTSLAATNIAFNINTLAFMPMIGFGIAVSVLLGQYLGKNNPRIAQRSVFSGFSLAFVYMCTMAVLYVTVPHIFIDPFALKSDPQEFEAIRSMTLIALKFVAVYSVFDTMNIIFASALKGAGDTRFVMYILGFASLFVLIIPAYIILVKLDGGFYSAWYIASIYIIMLGIMFFIRFMTGKWKSMRVIEPALPLVLPSCPEVPASQFEK